VLRLAHYLDSLQNKLAQYRLAHTHTLHYMQSEIKHCLHDYRQRLNTLSIQMDLTNKNYLMYVNNQFNKLAVSLQEQSPEKLLQKGYSILLKGNKIVKSIHSLSAHEQAELLLADGTADISVLELHANK